MQAGRPVWTPVKIDVRQDASTTLRSTLHGHNRFHPWRAAPVFLCTAAGTAPLAQCRGIRTCVPLHRSVETVGPPAAGPAALSHGLTRRQRQVQLPRFSTARPPPRKPAQETSVPLQQRTPPIPRTPLESNHQGGVHAERAEHSSAGAQAGPRLNEVTVYKKEPARQEMPRRFQSVSERPRNPTERRRRPLAASARSRYPPW